MKEMASGEQGRIEARGKIDGEKREMEGIGQGSLSFSTTLNFSPRCRMTSHFGAN